LKEGGKEGKGKEADLGGKAHRALLFADKKTSLI